MVVRDLTRRLTQTNNMVNKFLQINLNRSQVAQDMLQNFNAWNIDVVIISEPNYSPSSWLSDLTCSAAILFNPSHRFYIIDKGPGFVAARFGDLIVISCYYSPKLSVDEFKASLILLHNMIMATQHGKIIVASDFNVNLISWGSNRDTLKGHALAEAVASMDLRLANRGNTYTCVRPQGSSVVDLTWISPSLLSLLDNWIVLDNSYSESFSDHRYICFNIVGFV